MADNWSGFASDDKYWSQDHEVAAARRNREADLAWAAFRVHTDRLASFFAGARIGHKAFVR